MECRAVTPIHACARARAQHIHPRKGTRMLYPHASARTDALLLQPFLALELRAGAFSGLCYIDVDMMPLKMVSVLLPVTWAVLLDKRSDNGARIQLAEEEHATI